MGSPTSIPRVTLPQVGIEVSRLGFGGVRLTTLPSETDAIRILEHAFDRGITHFDVAPIYGFGRAESILGKFLRGKRDRVTVTTKAGVAPPVVLGRSHLAISLAKKVLRRFPVVLRQVKTFASARAVQGAFSAPAVVDSLHRSLRRIGTDHIDLFLLHEATVSDASNEALIQALEREVQKGSIRAFGVGSSFDKLGPRLASLPSAYRVVQTENSVAERNAHAMGPTARALITHSAFAPLPALTAKLRTESARVADLSLRIGLDLRDPDVLSSLALRYALDTNPSGVVVFSSEKPSHIDRNVRCAIEPPLPRQHLEALCELTDTTRAPGHEGHRALSFT